MYNNARYHTLAKPEKDDGYKLALKKSKTMIIDTKGRTFLGRNGVDWAKFLVLFWSIVLLSCLFLTGLFFIYTEGILGEDVPYRTGKQSALHNIPGLSFRPVTDFQTALIRYKDSDPSTYMMYIQTMRALLQTYEDAALISQDAYATCLNGKKTPDLVDIPCRFNLVWLDQCRKEYNFGYDRTKPCVLLKLNRIYGWVPDIQDSSFSNNTLVRCNGVYNEDIEYINEIRYFPNVTINNITYGYFDSLYYPYLMQYGYRQPLVGVQFDRPRKNVALMVVCHILNLKSITDSLTFEILVD